MTKDLSNTIFALASGAGRAGVAIIRVSGPDAFAALKSLSRAKLPKIRMASVRKIYDNDADLIDEALIIRFKGPASFTGEDLVEFHVHGGQSITDALSSTLLNLGLRQARAGEFSRRAFQNGRLDLTEAEGLADLIDAQTSNQRKQALKQMQGGLKHRYENWRTQIINTLALIEGELDFADEGDVPDDLSHSALPFLEALKHEFETALGDGARARAVRDGIEIAIIGPPNAGKSSFMNNLSGKDTAIVSPIAGTTRDIISTHMVLSGLEVRISDTAGLRYSTDDIEAEGVKRALALAKSADIRIFIHDFSNALNTEIPAVDLTIDQNPDDFVIYNKVDISENEIPKNVSRETFYLSAKTGLGMEGFKEALETILIDRFSVQESAGLTRARHRRCAQKALECTDRALRNINHTPELAGADLYQALHAIKELAGETDIEAVLDRVFSSFCIGK